MMSNVFETREHKRAVAGMLLTRMLGVPYKWGGQSFNQGFDCSGLAVEMLRAVGAIKAREDMTSAGLFEAYKEYIVTDPDAVKCGSLVFYGDKQGKINHVEIAIDPAHCIGASGGDSTTTTLERAREQQAEVKLRPIYGNREVIAIVDPFQLYPSMAETASTQ